MKTRKWDAADYLETPQDVAHYLEAAFEDGDSSLIAAALGDVARSKGMSVIATETGLGRESLYKALSPKGNPGFSYILNILQALGLQLRPVVQNAETIQSQEIDMTNVKSLVSAAFILASAQSQETMNDWTRISSTIGGELLPESLLVSSIQRIGHLDVLLRRMEQETARESPQPQFSRDVDYGFHHQVMFSEFWICESYEIFRLLKARKLLRGNNAFETLAHDLKLLRIPIAKHEIANDRKSSKPIQLQKMSAKGEVSGTYEYSHSDPRRSHIMGSGLSERGSVMWDALDCELNESRWLERLALSERIISLWQSDNSELQDTKAKDG